MRWWRSHCLSMKRRIRASMPGPACLVQKAWFLPEAPPPAAAGHILCLGARSWPV